MIRECFVPRPGRVFIQGDFPSLELFCLSQVCYSWFGHSALGEMLKAGTDPHTAFASKLARCTYDQGLVLAKSKDPKFYKYRQISKCFNFGKPGGLGHRKLCDLAATPAYGRVIITETESKGYGKEWLETFPEMQEYFAKINATLAGNETGTTKIPLTGFVRGGAKYCALANTPFQHLGAACAKNAMWLVAKAMYTEPESPLWGARTVAMVHDELIGEAEEATCHESAHELVRLMVVGANKFLPDCPIALSRMEPTIFRKWSKNASQKWENGRLVSWD